MSNQNNQDIFYLLDSRAGFSAATNGGKIALGDPGKYVLLADTLIECCRAANSGEYGEFNVVSDSKYNILWEIYTVFGDWSPALFYKKSSTE